MLNINFDHKSNDLIAAFSADKNVLDKVRSLILYHSLSQPYLIKDLYGYDLARQDVDNDPSFHESVPVEIRMVSAVLEKCFMSCTSDIEQFTTLLLFKEQRSTAIEIYKAYETYQHIDQINDAILKTLENHEVSIEQQMSLLTLRETIKNMSELEDLFEYVRASSGSYDIFKSLVPNNNPVQFLLSKLQNIIMRYEEEDDDK